jgi:hypothetical protein
MVPPGGPCEIPALGALLFGILYGNQPEQKIRLVKWRSPQKPPIRANAAVFCSGKPAKNGEIEVLETREAPQLDSGERRNPPISG